MTSKLFGYNIRLCSRNLDEEVNDLKNRNLINARKSRGWTQKKLAEKLGCQKSTISNWENGYSVPKLPDAFKLSNLLGWDINDLFLDEQVQDSHTPSA